MTSTHFLPKSVGEYKYYDFCRLCKSTNLLPVIHLGYVPLAGGFLMNKNSITHEKFYPLTLSFCKRCYLVQTNEVVHADTLFQHYYYRSSAIKTLVNHFEQVSIELKSRFPNQGEKRFVIEIGSNDGSLLSFLLKKGFKAMGIDPAENIVEPLIKSGLPIVNDYFTADVAKKIAKKYGRADVIFSSNTLAHIENMHSVLKGVKTLLKKNGILIFENHYLGNLIKELQYDMIYHEHQYYYSLLALNNFLKQYKLEVFDVKPISIHAGSMRYYVQNKTTGKHKVSENVKKLQREEEKNGLNKIQTFVNYKKKIDQTKKNLLGLLKKLKKEKSRIVGYGASGRGSTIMNYVGLTDKILDYVVDDAPSKQGSYTPGTHLKIYSSDILYNKKKPDFVVLFAWSFYEEIVAKHKRFLKLGGKFIIPLPKVKIIDSSHIK